MGQLSKNNSAIPISQIVFFILLYFYSADSQLCDSFKSTDLIQSGVLNLKSNDIKFNQSNFYGVVVSNFRTLNNKYQIAISTQSIKEYHPQNGVNYYVRANSNSVRNNSVSFQVYIQQERKWQFVQISYIISLNSNIVVGWSQQIRTRNFNGIGFETVRVSLNRNKIISGRNYSAEVFISGLNTNSSQFSLSIQQKIFDESQSILTVYFQKRGNQQISNIYFSYIIYSTQGSIFRFNVHHSTYELKGLKKIQEDQIITRKFTICRQIQKCLQNQILTDGKCECLPNYNRVQGICRRQCQPNAYLNDANQCVCFQDYKRIEEKCSRCQVGQYYFQDQKRCLLCSSFCLECSDTFSCKECRQGFTIVSQDFFGFNSSFCQSFCGNKNISIVEQCDDGNTDNGDGCSQQCQIQQNWSCYQESQMYNSICQQFKQNRIYLIISRYITLSNRTVVQIFLSQIPQCFDKACTNCEQLFDIKILKAPIPLAINIDYAQQTKFLLNFQYQDGRRLNNQFQFQIKLKQYENCLNSEDLKPIYRKIIDPSNI